MTFNLNRNGYFKHFCTVKMAVHIGIVVLFILNGLVGLSQKTYTTKRLSGEITLDGNWEDEAWKDVPTATDFVVNFPNPNTPSLQKSEVKMAFNNEAFYIVAKLYDINPDSVMDILSQRDDFGNADHFAVLIDPYGTGQNAFTFAVTAAGVELDAIISQTNSDYSWNSVWKSRVQRTDFGWALEMRIPLSQLRFPVEEVQKWKVNFKRNIRRNRETSYWNPVDPATYGEIAQSGFMDGIVGLKSPLRLFFSPYSTAYLDNFYNSSTQQQEWGFRQRFGMDMKLGLSESFTLDATLVPDFGQTASDNLVLNLTPFEIRYNENRPFFLEGTDLFGIGGLFYSRRIGASPALSNVAFNQINKEKGELKVANNQAQLLNATKISGRTKNGLGIGVFNAIENRSHFTYIDSNGIEKKVLAHPLTNYNVLVFSQNLARNGSVSFVNTNVFREDSRSYANVTGSEALLFNKSQKYSLFTSAQVSNSGTKLTTDGFTMYHKIEKVKGARTFFIDGYACSNFFNPNDLGFLPVNNFKGFDLQYKWVGFKPKGRFLRRVFETKTNLEYLYAPNKFTYWKIDGRVLGTFKNFLTSAVDFTLYPVKEVDHFESRTFGKSLNYPASFQFGGFYSSDYSKPFALDFNLYSRKYFKEGMYNIDAYVGPRIRFSNKLFVVLGSSVSRLMGNYGYVRNTDTLFKNDITIGTRNRWTVNNFVSADYTFTNRMGITLRLNHNWQEVNYSYFSRLLDNGNLERMNYLGIDASTNQIKHNTSFNAFVVDLVYRWVIYPGSEIRFVWKYNIYASKNALDYSYFNTFRDLFDQPQLNSFSVKALFFLDANKVRRKK